MSDTWPGLRPYTEPLAVSGAATRWWQALMPMLGDRNQCHADRSKRMACWCGMHKKDGMQ